jgi:toxin ParE1/3/4
MPGFVLSQEADEDLDDIHDFIARDDPEQAVRFLLKILELLSLLANNPAMGSSRQDIQKEMRAFPHDSYVIYYIPDEVGVEIIRVLHSARDTAVIFAKNLPN